MTGWPAPTAVVRSVRRERPRCRAPPHCQPGRPGVPESGRTWVTLPLAGVRRSLRPTRDTRRRPTPPGRSSTEPGIRGSGSPLRPPPPPGWPGRYHRHAPEAPLPPDPGIPPIAVQAGHDLLPDDLVVRTAGPVLEQQPYPPGLQRQPMHFLAEQRQQPLAGVQTSSMESGIPGDTVVARTRSSRARPSWSFRLKWKRTRPWLSRALAATARSVSPSMPRRRATSCAALKISSRRVASAAFCPGMASPLLDIDQLVNEGYTAFTAWSIERRVRLLVPVAGLRPATTPPPGRRRCYGPPL